MKFSIKTEDFSSKFVVYDTDGLERYLITNELNSVMRKLSIYDLGKSPSIVKLSIRDHNIVFSFYLSG